MNQKDLSILDHMNITGDVIVINQCDQYQYTERRLNNHCQRMFSFNERGVGKSRNNALMRSNADICLMADDDMVYVDNYEEIVINAFKERPEADMIMFNVPINKKDGKRIVKVKKNERIRFKNCLKYGTVNIAFKREKIVNKNVYFSLLFGGGARYSCGEDTLFITECLNKGIKIYSNTACIAEINDGESSWFQGYNEKFFYDKGTLFAAVSKNLAYILAIQFVVRKRRLFEKEIKPKTALSLMFKGIRNFGREDSVF